MSAEPAEGDAATGSAPAGYVEMEAAGILILDGSHTLGLVSDDEEVLVPISIGGTEALSISLRLEEESFARPLTHDLLDSVLEELGGELAHVQIDRIHRGTFHASVHLDAGDDVISIDSRSSDAVAMAVGADVAIYVSEDVIDDSGIDRDELERRTPPGQRPRLSPPSDDDEDDDTIEARPVSRSPHRAG